MKAANSQTLQQIVAYITELELRGQPIPNEILSQLFRNTPDAEIHWPIDYNGYFYTKNRHFKANNANQQNLIKSNARFSALISGRGGGKSGAGSQKALMKISQGQSGAVLNPDFENFSISTWPEFREWIPWSLVVATQRHRKDPSWKPDRPFILVFENGVSVICKGLKDADSARGPNINWLWYDEAGRDKDGLAWLNAIASVRIGQDPQAWITTTPRGKSHWIYRFFIEKEIDPEIIKLFTSATNRPLIEVFYTTLYENKDNLDPGFMASLLAAYPAGWLQRQEIYGEFVSQEGAIGGPAAEALEKNLVDTIPEDVFSTIRFYDLAATEKKVIEGKVVNDPDETVGTRMSYTKKLFCIEDQIGGFWSWDDIKKNIVETALKDGPTVRIVVEQEPAAGGKNQVAELASFIKKELPGWPTVTGWLPRDAGDRVMGANTWFAECVQNRICMLRGKWNTVFIDQVRDFPVASHDDHVTSVTGARYNLAPIKLWRNIPFLKV